MIKLGLSLALVACNYCLAQPMDDPAWQQAQPPRQAKP